MTDPAKVVELAQAQVPQKRPAIPPREPKGNAEWSVIVRHSPLRFKKAIVTATSREQAWTKFLDEATAKTTPAEFKAEGRKESTKHLHQALEWLAAARKEMPPGVEILGAEYVRRRLDALRLRGTVTVDQIGFPELASA